MTDALHLPGNVPLKAYRNRRYNISFVYPETWAQYDLAVEGGQGVVFAPSPELTTRLQCECRDLGVAVTAKDLPVLRRGFLMGLEQVPGSVLESRTDYDVGFLLGLEVRQSFLEGEERRKRWIRLLYKGSLQVRLIAQGASEAEFERWLPVFDPAMTNFVFGDVWPELTPDPTDAEKRVWLDQVLDPSARERDAS